VCRTLHPVAVREQLTAERLGVPQAVARHPTVWSAPSQAR
jgi:hypothetical protein